MKPLGSIERVEQAAAAAGLAIEIRRMGASTRTAEEAAQQCGCATGQIVKSLVFQGNDSGRLYLFLMPGSNQLDLDKAAALTAEPLSRADPRKIRDETGFAIGGVAPIGHLIALAAFADEALQWIERLQPRKAYLIHMHIPLDYATVMAETPDHVEPAYDGLSFELPIE